MIHVYLNKQTVLVAANGALPQFIALAIVWAEQVLVFSTEAKLRSMASNERFHNHRKWDFCQELSTLLGTRGLWMHTAVIIPKPQLLFLSKILMHALCVDIGNPII
jgi:hypothetical protein